MPVPCRRTGARDVGDLAPLGRLEVEFVKVIHAIAAVVPGGAQKSARCRNATDGTSH